MTITLNSALEYLNTYQNSSTQSKIPANKKSEVGVKVWQKQPAGTWKLNVDACVNEVDGRFSIGGIVRNSNGYAILAFDKSRPRPVLEGELQALKEGISIAASKNFSPLLVESDSLLAVQAVSQNSESWGYGELWITDILLLRNKLSEVSIKHVQRSANKVADKILFLFLLSLPLFGR